MVRSRTPETTLRAEHFRVLSGALQPLGRSALSALYLLHPLTSQEDEQVVAKPWPGLEEMVLMPTQLRPTQVLLLEYS